MGDIGLVFIIYPCYALDILWGISFFFALNEIIISSIPFRWVFLLSGGIIHSLLAYGFTEWIMSRAEIARCNRRHSY